MRNDEFIAWSKKNDKEILKHLVMSENMDHRKIKPYVQMHVECQYNRTVKSGGSLETKLRHIGLFPDIQNIQVHTGKSV